jgi:fibronectin type 3 domain-containing protein
MMFIGNKIYHFAIPVIFLCLSSLWATVSLHGCGGNIPSARELVSSGVTLKWKEVKGAISYNVYGSTSPGVTKLSGYKFRNTPNPFTITQLEPGKTYYFIVTVITDSGESEESKELSYTAVMDKVEVIDFSNLFDRPIKHLESSTSKNKDVTLTWDNVPNATSYNIYWSDSPGVTKLNGKKISNAENPHTVKGLKPGTYYFVVTAVNAFGESAESAEFSFSLD